MARFQKGQSGNPGGRPKADFAIQELARSHGPAAIETLAKIAAKGKSEVGANRCDDRPARSRLRQARPAQHDEPGAVEDSHRPD